MSAIVEVVRNSLAFAKFTAFIRFRIENCWNNPLVYTDPNGKCPTCPDNMYVNLADAAYTVKQGESIGGWKAIRVFEPGGGYRGVVFEGTYKGNTEYVFATAGTGGSGSALDTVEDVITDATQLAGLSGQYQGTVQLARYLAETYSGISFTGHSLGGGLAAANAMSVNGKAVTFNAAGLSAMTMIDLGLLGRRAIIHAYIVNGELLDRVQPDKANGTRIYMGNRISLSQALGAHKMESVRNAFNDYWFWSQLRMLSFSILVPKSESELPKLISNKDACKKYGGDACK